MKYLPMLTTRHAKIFMSNAVNSAKLKYNNNKPGKTHIYLRINKLYSIQIMAHIQTGNKLQPHILT